MAQLRPLLALSVALLAALSWLADARPLPRINPSEADAWEGQTVIVTGWANDVQEQRDGAQRMVLRKNGQGVAALARISDVQLGDWVEATGRLARLSGNLLLLAERLDVVQSPGLATPSWDELATHVDRYVGEPIRLNGTIAGDRLRDDRGHSIALAPGPWPPNGPAQLVGLLAYDATCLCHRLEPASPQWMA